MSLKAVFERTLRALLTVSCLSLFFCVGAKAESIKYFDTQVRVGKDSNVYVTETVFVDFSGADRHGFTRTIPLTYQRGGGAYTAGFRLLSVTENAGDRNDIPVKIKVARHEDAVTITIGDANTAMSGRHVYRYNYLLRNAINHVEGLPELVFSLNGSELPIPIQNAKVSVFPPEGILPTTIAMDAFVGAPGSKDRVEMQVENQAVVYSLSPVNPGDEFVVIAGFPKNAVVPPTVFHELLYWLADWWPAIFLPLASILVMWMVFWQYGRDASKIEVPFAGWTPPTEMSPAEVGTLYDERCDTQDIIATLIDLAHRGHLKIKEVEKVNASAVGHCDYLFVKTSAPSDDPPLRGYEKDFLDAIFNGESECRLSTLKGKFSARLPAIRQGIYEALTQEGYFQDNPETVRQNYKSLAMFFCLLGMLFILASSADAGFTPIGVGLVACAAVVGTFSFAMPARTQKGISALERSLGFVMFIQESAKGKIDILVSEDADIFARLLPYALVLGAADKWAESFVEVIKEPPVWYEMRGTQQAFLADRFVADLGAGMRVMEAAMTSEPPDASASLLLSKS